MVIAASKEIIIKHKVIIKIYFLYFWYKTRLFSSSNELFVIEIYIISV